jgi:hypothetical protein
MFSTGANFTFFFNDRRFSKWDLGFTTGVGYKSLRSTYTLDNYIDTLAISDDYTAQQLGGTYDLYVDAKSLEQRNLIKTLEVPLQFTACYNFTKKRNLGIYTRIGGLFNLVLSNDHTMEDGTVTYTGHIKKFINGEPTHYYFNSDLPERLLLMKPGQATKTSLSYRIIISEEGLTSGSSGPTGTNRSDSVSAPLSISILPISWLRPYR